MDLLIMLVWAVAFPCLGLAFLLWLARLEDGLPAAVRKAARAPDPPPVLAIPVRPGAMPAMPAPPTDTTEPVTVGVAESGPPVGAEPGGSRLPVGAEVPAAPAGTEVGPAPAVAGPARVAVPVVDVGLLAATADAAAGPSLPPAAPGLLAAATAAATSVTEVPAQAPAPALETDPLTAPTG